MPPHTNRERRYCTGFSGLRNYPQDTGTRPARLQGSNTCLGTLILGRGRRFGRRFAQPLPHVAVFFDEPFERVGAHAFLTVLLKAVRHLLQIFGMLLEVRVDFVLVIRCEARGTSRTRLVIHADQPCAVPALHPLRHGVARDLIDGRNTA